jgi:hypothetical protein
VALLFLNGLHIGVGAIGSEFDGFGTPPNSNGRMQNESSSNCQATQWVNKAEIALHFKCSIRHVNELMHRRILPFVKIGRFVRFDVAACDQAMKNFQTRSLFA